MLHIAPAYLLPSLAKPAHHQAGSPHHIVAPLGLLQRATNPRHSSCRGAIAAGVSSHSPPSPSSSLPLLLALQALA